MTVRRFVAGGAAVLLFLPAFAAPPTALLLAAAAAVALGAAVLPWSPERPGRAACGAFAVSWLVDAVYAGEPGLVLLWLPVELAGLLVLTGRLLRCAPGRRVAVLGALAVLTCVATPLRFSLRHPPDLLGGSVLMAAATLFPVGCAVGVGCYLRALDERRRTAVLRARREQRLAVAADLHDFVAHELTGMVVEAQAAQTGPYDEKETRELLARLAESGSRALDSMDHTLRALRAAEDDDGAALVRRGLHELPDLVGRFGHPAVLDVRDEGLRLAPAADDAAHRVAVEALTNVRRHAPHAGRVTVTVAPGDGTLTLTITDDAPPRARVRRTDGGTGLAALAERVRLCDGTFEAGRTADGWTVKATLPTTAP
ncbi:sensor histidine kinase [Streptomyces sp. NPDC059639]|uniref:sensor histidine kinase n=1 Tax=Streptomyces sp. NPDC059639 TaxID=3346891 RepID=UPI00369F48E8